VFRVVLRRALNAPRCSSAPLIGLLLVLALGLAGCGKDNPASPGEPDATTGFTNGYQLENWHSTGILQGTTDMALTAGSGDQQADFSYHVNLGNPSGGVSFRTATFSVPAAATGTAIVEWTYTGYHAFYEAVAELTFFADQGQGIDSEHVTGVAYQAVGDAFTFSGADTVSVVAGEDFGFTIGGGNFDSDGQVLGNLHIARLTIQAVAPPPTYTVSGRVFYSTTPLNGVRVELIRGHLSSAPRDTVYTVDGAYAFTSVPPADLYFIKVYGPTPEFIGWTAYGESVHGNVTLDIHLPKLITLLTPANGSTVATTHPTLTWQANSEATRYSIQVDVTSSWQEVESGSSTTTQHTIAANLTPGVTYSWMVSGYDSHDNYVGTDSGAFRFTVGSK
jgi:hypothetical protein